MGSTPPLTKKKRRASGTEGSWASGAKGWKALDVGDDFLLGAEEGGFAGLEVLEDCNITMDPSFSGAETFAWTSVKPSKKANKKAPAATVAATEAAAAAAAAAAAGAGAAGSTAVVTPGSKKRKAQGSNAAANSNAATPATSVAKPDKGQQRSTDRAGVVDVGSLQAQLDALKRENERLKAAAGGSGHDSGANGVVVEGGLSGGAAKRKRKLEAYKAKMAAHREQRKLKDKQKKKKKKGDGKQHGDEQEGGQGQAPEEGQEQEQPQKKQKVEGRAKQGQAQTKPQQKSAADASQQHGTQKQKQKQKLTNGSAAAATGLAAGEERGAGGTVAAAEAGPQGAGAGPLADVSAWRVFALHPLLEKALALQGFSAPTPIQSSVLPAVLRDRLDVIGAAQTGSGKTLAFGLPIMQTLLQELEAASAEGCSPPHANKLRALVMAPTRELALQVEAHLSAMGRVAGIRVAAIVGGLAHVKQERLLRACPAVVVATPGRLWELLREQTSPHLADLSGLSFLVLDEADRMVAKGHFQELSSILDLIPRPGGGQSTTYDADFNATLTAVNEIEARGTVSKRAKKRQGEEKGDEEEGEEGEEEPQSGDGLGESGEGIEDEESSGEREEQEHVGEGEETSLETIRERQRSSWQQHAGPAQGKQDQQGKRGASKGRGQLLQTMVFSATLTLPAALRKRLKKGGGGALGGTDLDNLMDRVPFRGEPVIVDLSSASRLASGVSESLVNCLSGTDRDAVLYYLLARHPGRALVFVNAVSALRRVAAILKLLGLPAHSLHAQQQQRQRLKALDSFKAKDQAVLVATDVAARGLDIRDVRMVIHYQLPASVDTYIHRSGRTARGAGAEGLSVALVAPEEAARWAVLVRAMGHKEAPPAFPVDATIMPKVVERLKLALRIDEEERASRKTAADTNWARRAAEEAGLDPGEVDGLDDDDDKTLTRARGDVRKAAQLASLKRQLAALLAQPLAPRMSRAYFTGGAVAGVALSSAPARGGAALTGSLGKKAQKTAETATEASAAAAASVSQAVTMAARLQAPSASKQATRTVGGVMAPMQKKRQQKRPSVEQLARQELARRTAVKKARRVPGTAGVAAVAAAKTAAKGAAGQGGRRRGLVVIPPAVSRDTQGQDALAALKRKLTG